MSKLPDLNAMQKAALRLIYNRDDQASYPEIAHVLDLKYWRAQQVVRSLMVWGLVTPVNRGGGRGSYRRFTYTDDGALVLRADDAARRRHNETIRRADEVYARGVSTQSSGLPSSPERAPKGEQQ